MHIPGQKVTCFFFFFFLKKSPAQTERGMKGGRMVAVETPSTDLGQMTPGDDHHSSRQNFNIQCASVMKGNHKGNYPFLLFTASFEKVTTSDKFRWK